MKKTLALLGAILVVTSCTGATESPGDSAQSGDVTLLAYDSFTPPEGIFSAFEDETGLRVNVVTGGDSGSVISKAILTAGNPEGDVLWGVDNTTFSRAEDAELFTDVAPVDEGDVCINYDKEWYASRTLEPPTSLDALITPTYKGQLVVQDPVNSSPGLAFLMATIAKYGDGWQNWWKALRANDVLVVSDWTSAYTVEFSGSSGKGRYPLVVSYGSSPPAEVLYAATPIDEPPTGVIESTCFRQTEYVGTLRGADNPDGAKKLMEFLLGRQFQESLPLSMFVFPVNPDAELPQLFQKFAVRVTDPLQIPADEIADKRDRWIDEWRAIVL
ncbi:MAG: thiamine ABC transporter substrate-binding protein [Ilumatobacteraceae bacterium]